MKNHNWETFKVYIFGKENKNCADLYIASLNFGNRLKENFTLIHEIWLLLINHNFL